MCDIVLLLSLTDMADKLLWVVSVVVVCVVVIGVVVVGIWRQKNGTNDASGKLILGEYKCTVLVILAQSRLRLCFTACCRKMGPVRSKIIHIHGGR